MKISRQQYASGKVGSVAIENCRDYWDWFSQNQLDVIKSRVFADNRITFRELWGKPDWRFNNGEFYFHVWIREYERETFAVLTAKGKGTCVELISPDEQMQSKMNADTAQR